MANNAQVANEGTQRCGNDSKTYTDDRIGMAGNAVISCDGVIGKIIAMVSFLSQRLFSRSSV